MTDRMIDNRVKKLQALEAQMAELKTQADALKDELKDELESRDLEEVRTGNFIVRWKTVVSNRLDSNRLKKELPDIYRNYLKESSSHRFTYVS